MNKKTFNIKRFIPSKRRLIQLYSALLFNANLKGFVNGRIYKGPVKNICTPGLNCYSCPGAVGACPLGALQNSLSASTHTIPFYVIGILLLYGLLFGRWICGFLCPFGLVQDLFYKIKTPKVRKNGFTRVLSRFKYVILILLVIVFPILYAFKNFPLPGFCKYICPAGTLEGAMGLLSNKFNDDLFVMLGPLFTWKFVLLVVILVCCVFFYRFFCRFLCPLGAIYGLFNKISFIGVKLDAPKCTDCGRCVTKCKMDVKNVGDTECISCGECISVCPTKAINWKGPKILLRSNEIDGNLSRESKENALKKSRNTKTAQVVCVILSVSLLIGSLYYFNFVDKAPDADPPPEQTQQDPNNDPDVQEAVVGNNIGNQCIAMDIKLLRGQEGYFNVNQNKGKVTIINFWGNWCGPCVQELPHFNEIAKEYAENVTVVAVHSDYGKKTADNYISENFSSFVTTFALDDSDAYFKALGGRDSWPVTVIVDPDGIIIFKQVGSVTYEELQNAVSPYVNN